MNEKFTYGDCYRILNANDKCSWDELRKSYKAQIQKWHPDRFEEGSAKKEAAEGKIKDINAAYHQLSKYYKENNSLPVIETTEKITKPRPTPTQEQNPKTAKPDTKTTKPITKTRNKEEKNNHTFFVIIVISIFIYMLIEFTPDVQDSPVNSKTTDLKITSSKLPQKFENTKMSEKNITDKTDVFLSNNKPKIKEEIDHDDIYEDVDTRFFTYGSNIGEVISIQGPPTETQGNTWYYGKSEVHFHEGIVIRWKRSSNDPIKAKLLLPKTDLD